jgi:hypothetical protein
MSADHFDWEAKEVLTAGQVAEVLATSRVQVHRLIDDWAFGDPARLPSVGVTRPAPRIPARLVRAFLDGDRQYPPGDPRGTPTTTTNGEH